VNKFEFIIKNLQILEELYFASDEGRISIEVDDYDFSYNDMTVDVDGDGLMFNIPAGMFTLTCSIPKSDIKESVKFMRNISNLEAREAVINIIENEIRPAAEDTYSESKDDYKLASDSVANSKDDLDNVIDSLTELKGEWGIP
jgi:hypothetical protein